MKKYILLLVIYTIINCSESLGQTKNYFRFTPTIGSIKKSCDTTREWIISQNCLKLEVDTITPTDTDEYKSTGLLIPVDSISNMLNFSIKCFTLVSSAKVEPPELVSTSNCLTSEQIRLINSSSKGTRLFFEKIIVIDNVTKKEYLISRPVIMINIH